MNARGYPRIFYSQHSVDSCSASCCFGNTQDSSELLPVLDVDPQDGSRTVPNQIWWILWAHQSPLPEIEMVKYSQIFFSWLSPSLNVSNYRSVWSTHDFLEYTWGTNFKMKQFRHKFSGKLHLAVFLATWF